MRWRGCEISPASLRVGSPSGPGLRGPSPDSTYDGSPFALLLSERGVGLFDFVGDAWDGLEEGASAAWHGLEAAGSWIAERWHDPAFPRAFPQFGTAAYWEAQLVDLHEQIQALEEDRTPGWALH